MSKGQAPREICLDDYRPPAWRVTACELDFSLASRDTVVRNRMRLEASGDTRDLWLDGEGLELIELHLDGEPLAVDRYRLEDGGLAIDDLPARCELEVVTRIDPEANTALEGLYLSSGNFCTQCEAEGFRRITYFPDRPDVLTRFRTRIEADRAHCPVLLSNGNLVEQGELPAGRHYAVWEDPWPKPCYLFALVAGDLAVVEDRYITASGREVALRIFVEHHNADRCGHAMRSLKRAMRWDEKVFGLEYDLDVYMIVAVDDFNMGAMENKGLNVFNSKFVLARPDTATDEDYVNIEAVIAHEYFHNWTGNRVTCRDWFQLSLKEGLTVFRDQQFTADMTSPTVKRIDDVRMLRTHQFAEDASPMAHPVRPRCYIEINNFYTLTVYEKGAEVVRMYHTLLGAEGFRRGMDLYFERHDGQAVTTDDFRRAMADANGVDLEQFALWYEQAGTPVVEASDHWDESSGRYELVLRQHIPPTPGQPEKQPMLIPVRLGLLGPAGETLPLDAEGRTETVLRLTEAEQRFVFEDLPARPLPSLLRGFSAPVRLEYPWSDAQLAFLMAHDDDDFNRWDAGQRLCERVLLAGVEAQRAGHTEPFPDLLREAFGRVLADRDRDPAFVAEALSLPGEALLAERMEVVDVDGIHVVRQALKRHLALALEADWLAAWEENRETRPDDLSAEALGRRRLLNLSLDYLVETGAETHRQRALEQYRAARNMTERMGALRALNAFPSPERSEALEDFGKAWKDDPLVMDKWFTLQAIAPFPETLDRVLSLMQHPHFSIRNPNRVRALVGAFVQSNPVGFHRRDGLGYRLLGDVVLELDRLNPQVAARLLRPLTRWRRYDETRAALMHAELERIMAREGLSRDVYEIVHHGLEDG